MGFTYKAKAQKDIKNLFRIILTLIFLKMNIFQ